MSLTPTIPNLSLKSFWQRPEGKTGTIILLATAIAGIYGVSLMLPWLILLLSNTLTAAALGVALFALLYIVTNKTFRSIVGNTFRLGMRWMTGLLVEIDPIGILENTRDKMNENNEKLSKAVEGTRGAKQLVQSEIQKNTIAIQRATSIKEQAEREAAKTTSPLLVQRLALQKTMELQEIGRKLKSNEKLSAILTQTSKLYDMLTRWQQLAEFNVDNMSAEIDNAKAERKTILQAYAGLGFAQKIIKGDPEQLKMMNASLEYLAQDNAMKLGAMEDFARYSEKYLTQMDLEQGASAADAEKMLSEYETKLLSAGSPATIVPAVFTQPETVNVPRASKVIEPDYLDSLYK